jgi:hypothetical protein
MPRSPAELHGFRVGDIIERIDNVEAQDRSVAHACATRHRSAGMQYGCNHVHVGQEAGRSHHIPGKAGTCEQLK